MDRPSRQEINKETMALNDTLDKMDLIYIFRTFYLKRAEYTFFSSAHKTFPRTDHTLAQQTSLNNFNKIQIITIPSIFSDHSTMKLEVNHKNNSGNATNTWRLNNMLLIQQTDQPGDKRRNKKYMETNENENTVVQNFGDAAKAVLRGKFTAIQVYLNKQENQVQINNLSLLRRTINKT